MQGSTKDGCARQEEEEEEEEDDVWHEKNTKRCFTIVVGASFFANCIS
jgi:hypothetical protein